MPGIYDELSELIEKAQIDDKATTEHWSFYRINSSLVFYCKGHKVASYENNELTLYRDEIEATFLQREFLLKRLTPFTGSEKVYYKSLEGVSEVFLTYNFKKGRCGTAHYATDSGIIRMPDGNLLRVYKHHAPFILDKLSDYVVTKAEDAPEPMYAVSIKQCSKCNEPYMTRFTTAHSRRNCCWRCKP